MPGFRSEVMVGRERELDELRTVAARVLDREPSTAVVIGEAGVGKSRLASELATELGHQRWICAVSHGVELAGGEIPFGAAAEMLRSLVRDVGIEELRRGAGHKAQVLAAVLPALGRTGDTPPVDRAEVVSAVLTLLEGLNRPVCWVLDDLQWMDDATCDLTAYLSRVLADAPVLLLATVRTRPDAPGDLPPELVGIGRAATVVTLGPLGPDEVAAQVAAIPGHHLGAPQVARICDVSDGLPFFVEQLVMSEGRVTGSLRSVVLAGFRTLTPQARTLLSAAAVGEGMLVPRYLREVSGLGAAFGPALDELRERGLLRPDREGELLAFRHALLRETVDSSMLSDERQELHRTWGDALETGLVAAPGDRRLVMERARHRYAVGGEDAYPAALEAARLADVSDDDQVRARWWGRALELWPPDQARGPSLDRDRALARYLEALWAAAEHEEFTSVLDRELAGSNDWVRSLWLNLARRNARVGAQLSWDSPIPPEEADTTVARLLAIPADFRVSWLLVNLALDWFVDSALDRPELAVRMLEEAIRRADPDTDAQSVVDAYSLLGWCDAASGDHEHEVARKRQALDWVLEHRPSSLPYARIDLCMSLVTPGHYAEAVALAEENLRDIRDPLLRPHLWVAQHLVLAAAHLWSGGWDSTARSLELADTDACGGDIGSWRDFLCAILSARRGDLTTARAHLGEIRASPVDAPHGRLERERLFREFATMEIGVAEGDVEAVRSAALGVADLIQPHTSPVDVWNAFATGLRVAVGRARRDPVTTDFLSRTARELAARQHEGRQIGTCRTEIEAHRRRAVDTDSADEWATVGELYNGVGETYDAAWCQLFEAECALRDGDPERGRAALQAARATCARLGAVPLLERVEATARRARVDGVIPQESEAGLTVRETEVLRLLAEGLTNVQIAESLFMSPKTASVHVSHIIAKLGVANRTEAAALAHRQGLAAPRN